MDTRRCAAFSLIELTVSLAICAMLMAALGSAVAIAAAALPEANSSETRILDSSRALERLSADLEGTLYVLDTSPGAPVVGIPDRNKDGAPDTFAIVWTGSRVDPIQVVENGATPEAVLDSASAFGVEFEALASDLVVEGSPQESPEVSLGEYSTAPTKLDHHDLAENILWCQVIEPVLPADALLWYVDEIDIAGVRVGNNKGEFRVQLRPVTPGEPPSDTVLEEQVLKENRFGDGVDKWFKINFSGDAGLDPAQHVGFVIAAEVKPPAGSFEIEDGTGQGLWTADASGGSLELMLSGDETPAWSVSVNHQMLYQIFGRYVTREDGLTVTRNFMTSVSVSVSAAGDTDVDMDTTVNLINRPQIVRSIWEAEFGTDPSVHDINADGVEDWAVDGGGPILSSFLIDGCWKANDIIRTQPAKDLTGPVIGEVRWRSTNQAQAGAAWTLNFDQSGGLQGNIRIQQGMSSATEQALAMTTSNGAGTTNVLATVTGLDTELVTVRVVVDPVNDVVALSVNGNAIGSYPYLSRAYASDERVSIVEPLGNGVEVDYVRIREGGAP